ncbi:MAG: hypothetical protein H6828_08975 [Planctomycetes bacterium]|nr:hypothetical protein [Planctomycetota bacterium]
MSGTSRLVHAALGALAAAPLAGAQNLHVDFRNVGGTFGEPSNTYAADGELGEWNAVNLAVPGAWSLIDTHGNPLAATLMLGPGFTGDGQHNDFTLSGDAARLLEDWLVADVAASFSFAGLDDGHYVVSTYAWASDQPTSTLTSVSVPGSSDPAQTVGGAGWSGLIVPGVTHARHEVDVVGGTLQVQLATVAQRATVNGVSLVRVPPGFALYCYADGGGVACPCGNSGSPGRGCANSTGAGARLSGLGSASVSSLTNLLLQGSGFTPQQPALLFAGANAVNGGAGAPFGDGLRCVGGGVTRLGTYFCDPDGEVFWYATGYRAAEGPGVTRRFQAWYRDPQGSPCGSAFNLSNGVEVTFAP